MKELQGTTLKVYLHILKSGKERIGVRELMRDMNMKTPSHAYYHLDKLVSIGLLEKRYGDYYIVKNIKIEYLRDFIFIGSSLIPKFLFYSVFFIVILIYSIIFPRIYELYWYITVISSAAGFTVAIYETLISMRKIQT
jgi:DNA-binding transcriptional ArsR family regulator